jgi:hypothetical protein
MIASALLACPAGAVNVAADVTYNNWEVRNEQGCTAASQIIDADSYSAYGDGRQFMARMARARGPSTAVPPLAHRPAAMSRE